ncbi:protein translocase subunit SecD [Vallicoccus soli]|uniref:Protein translocase subunit SecD n=1 Tax=Vallicoccus soli TaxID=2339232 RepID=A0A3A3Z0T1_9ACTN|nr:protein translocase subunit SecD [Vallicoccus soli]RJK96793.1 protein translocase subunit SecD [Vallicoccus soli]
MAGPPGATRPGRAIAVLAALGVALYALILVVAPDRVAGRALSLVDTYTPQLGLDLRGGTEIVLRPVVAAGAEGSITDENINEAIGIIRQRVDGTGVAEAEVSSQGSGGGRTIVIQIPGERNEQVLAQVQQTAELRFRQVLAVDNGTPLPQPTPGATPGATPAAPAPGATVQPGATPGAGGAGGDGAEAPAGIAETPPDPAPQPTSDGREAPRALAAATPAAPAATPAPTPGATPAPAQEQAPAEGPFTAAEVPQRVQQAFQRLDCSDPPERTGPSDPGAPIASCGDDGLKYLLSPAVLVGTDVAGATSGLQALPNGGVSNTWEVRLDFTGEGTRKFADETARVNVLPPPENQLAIVLDDRVVSAPTINEAIPGGSASITGSFTQESAEDLANVLRYGALPLAFEPQSVNEVSPTLGDESLRGGLIAGGLGLLAVVLYMLVYYRLLGLVAVASLVVATIGTWGLLVFLGWQIGYALTLAGIAGAIVSIGVTADSFVIYFERIRDEVREGRTVRVAAETGWRRARRTIIASDVVSLLAAVVLYFLSSSSVRGFAFTLGLTTLVDVIVVFLFTKPLVTLFVRSRGLSTGGMSGLDAKRLGAVPGSSPSPSLAMARARERRRVAEAGAASGATSMGKDL